nr:hypothetical protein [Helicobacter winghamensis]
MPANFGVNINISNAAASPIKIQSQTPIGIAAAIKGASKEAIYALAGYNSTEENPIFAFSNVSKAKEFVSTLIKEQNLQDYRLLVLWITQKAKERALFILLENALI